MIALVLLLLAASSLQAQQVCATCHASIAASYARTGMGRAFAKASTANVPLTKQTFHHQPSGTNFEIVRRGAKFIHRRWRNNGDLEELEIHWVMGSGNHARTFLHQNARGELIELPLGWYAEAGGTFAMNPGFDHTQPATRRKIDFDCYFCHNAYPRKVLPEPAFDAQLPTGIDCTRCHGSPVRHLAKPGRGNITKTQDVCLACHLETTSSRLPSMIRRFEREPFSYKPGEALSNYFLFFDHAPGKGHDEKFEIVNAAYRMRQSKCFLQSGTMTCTTCHDPHKQGVKANQCSQCHNMPTHNAGSNCTTCHMPKRRTEDVVHVVMTDHFIRRKPIEGDPLAPRAERHGPEYDYQGEVVPYLTIAPPVYVAAAQVLHGSNLLKGIADLERLKPLPHPEFYVTLGNGYLQIQKPAQAVEAFAEAARLKPNSTREQRLLGVALMEAGRRQEAESVLAANANDAGSLHQLALLASARGDFRDAIAKAERAIVLDPDLLEARNSLAANLASIGDKPRAESVLIETLRINPYDATAHANLARLTSSLDHFAEAIRLRPDFAPDRYDYAVLLYRSKRTAEAKAQYESTVALQPNHGRAHLDLARIAMAEGDRAKAIDHLRRAAAGDDPATAQFAKEALNKLANP